MVMGIEGRYRMPFPLATWSRAWVTLRTPAVSQGLDASRAPGPDGPKAHLESFPVLPVEASSDLASRISCAGLNAREVVSLRAPPAIPTSSAIHVTRGDAVPVLDHFEYHGKQPPTGNDDQGNAPQD